MPTERELLLEEIRREEIRRGKTAERETLRRKYGPVQAGAIAAGETLTSLGRGAAARLGGEGRYNPALMLASPPALILGQLLNRVNPDELTAQQAKESALVEPLREARPVATTLGDVAATAAIPGGVTRTGALAGGALLGGMDIRNDPLTGAATGAAAGLLGREAARGVSRLISPGGQVTDRGAQRQFREAAKRIGYKPTAAQVTGSKGQQAVEQGARALPGAGGAFEVLDEANQRALNRAALKAIGEKGEELTDEVIARADRRIGDVYERLTKNRTIAFRAADRQAVADLADEFLGALETTKDAPQANIIKDLAGVLSEPSAKSDDVLRVARIFTRQARSAGDNADLRTLATDAAALLRDTVGRDLPDADRAAFNEARSQWRNLVALYRRGSVNPATGDVSPRGVASALQTLDKRSYLRSTNRRGPLQDIARIGRTPVRSFGNSGTAERILAGGGLLGAGAAAMTGNVDALAALGAAYGGGAVLGNLYAAPAVQRALAAQTLSPQAFDIIGRAGTAFARSQALGNSETRRRRKAGQ